MSGSERARRVVALLPSLAAFAGQNTRILFGRQYSLSQLSVWDPLHRTRRFSAAQAEPETKDERIRLTNDAVQRLHELVKDSEAGTVLRVSVDGGGCSGFQYEFNLDTTAMVGDRVFEQDGVKVVCDGVSYEFLRGAVVDYQSDLMRSAFQVMENPNAESSCGCGSSFVAK